MGDETGPNLPSPTNDAAQSGEMVLSSHNGGLLVGGDPDAVESYLERLRKAAGRTVQTAGIDTASVGTMTGLAAGLASVLGNRGQYVQLHPDSLTALRDGKWIPGTDGFFRMMTRDADGQFLTQLQWRPTQLGPEVMMSAQMVAVQMALKSAIAEVEEAVRRVEGKVDAVLKLAQATRSGDVIGNNMTVSRMVDSVEEHGSLPDAYWDSIAGLGPALNVTVEQLRNHVTRVLANFDHKLAIQERAQKLKEANEEHLLGETLSLLVVAEETLYKWERLNLARVESTEPHHLPRAISEARQLLVHQLEQDAAVYRNAKEVLDKFTKPEAVEGFRFRSIRELTKQRAKLRAELDDFANARRHQIATWEDFEIPGFLDAASATLDKALVTTGRALEAAGQGLDRLGKYLAEPKEKPVAQPAPRQGDSTERKSD